MSVVHTGARLAAALDRCAEITARSAERFGPDLPQRIEAVRELRREHEERQAQIEDALTRRENFTRRHPRTRRSTDV